MGGEWGDVEGLQAGPAEGPGGEGGAQREKGRCAGAGAGAGAVGRVGRLRSAGSRCGWGPGGAFRANPGGGGPRKSPWGREV